MQRVDGELAARLDAEGGAVAVAAGGTFCLALTASGRAVLWGTPPTVTAPTSAGLTMMTPPTGSDGASSSQQQQQQQQQPVAKSSSPQQAPSPSSSSSSVGIEGAPVSAAAAWAAQSLVRAVRAGLFEAAPVAARLFGKERIPCRGCAVLLFAPSSKSLLSEDERVLFGACVARRRARADARGTRARRTQQTCTALVLVPKGALDTNANSSSALVGLPVRIRALQGRWCPTRVPCHCRPRGVASPTLNAESSAALSIRTRTAALRLGCFGWALWGLLPPARPCLFWLPHRCGCHAPADRLNLCCVGIQARPHLPCCLTSFMLRVEMQARQRRLEAGVVPGLPRLTHVAAGHHHALLSDGRRVWLIGRSLGPTGQETLAAPWDTPLVSARLFVGQSVVSPWARASSGIRSRFGRRSTRLACGRERCARKATATGCVGWWLRARPSPSLQLLAVPFPSLFPALSSLSFRPGVCLFGHLGEARAQLPGVSDVSAQRQASQRHTHGALPKGSG